MRKSNPGHIGGRQVLSPLGQPCHPKSFKLSFYVIIQRCSYVIISSQRGNRSIPRIYHGLQFCKPGNVELQPSFVDWNTVSSFIDTILINGSRNGNDSIEFPTGTCASHEPYVVVKITLCAISSCVFVTGLLWFASLTVRFRGSLRFKTYKSCLCSSRCLQCSNFKLQCLHFTFNRKQK